MTVQELIDELEKVEDKSKLICEAGANATPNPHNQCTC